MPQVNGRSLKELVGQLLGPVRSYLLDMASPETCPDISRIEAMTFRATINAAGTITAQTAPSTILPGHYFGFKRLYGWMENPAGQPSAPSLVDVQVEEDGRNFDIFRQPVNMAQLVGDGGPCHVLEWETMYKCRKGSTLTVTFNIDATRWAALVGVEKIVGVTLVGSLLNAEKC